VKKSVINIFICTLSASCLSVASATEEDAAVRLDETTVTATREAQLVSETAVSVGVVSQDVIDEVKPAHPSEIMERIHPLRRERFISILKMEYLRVQRASLTIMRCMK